MYDQQMNFARGLELHPQHAERIGAIVARWNTIERACGQLLWLFAGCNPTQGLLLLGAVQGARNRIGLVRTAGEYYLKESERLSEFKEMMNKLMKTSEKRNQYAHGLYAVNDKGQLVRITAREDWITMDPPPEPLTLDTLQNDLIEFDDALSRIIRFHSRLWQETSREMQEALQKLWLLRDGQNDPRLTAPIDHPPEQTSAPL